MANDPHDRITHMDLLDLWRDEMASLRNEVKSEIRDLRNEMRWLIGISLALMMLFMAFVTLFVR